MPGPDPPVPNHLLRARILAYGLDILMLFVVLAPVGWLVQQLLPPTSPTGPQIWTTLLWNFSLPTWIYFIASDAGVRGASLGKRIFRIQVVEERGVRLGVRCALARTAAKLLPWELVHLSAFGLSEDMGQLNLIQAVLLVLANVLVVLYLVAAVASGGRRSVHDHIAHTIVRAAPVHQD